MNKPHRYLTRAYSTPTPVHAPLIPLPEMVARIEAVRLEAAPDCCPVCRSTVGEMARVRLIRTMIREAVL